MKSRRLDKDGVYTSKVTKQTDRHKTRTTNSHTQKQDDSSNRRGGGGGDRPTLTNHSTFLGDKQSENRTIHSYTYIQTEREGDFKLQVYVRETALPLETRPPFLVGKELTQTQTRYYTNTDIDNYFY